MMRIVKIFGPRGLSPPIWDVWGIVMMKIVNIYGPRGIGPPIWDILDSDGEDCKNIWTKGDVVLQFGMFGIVMIR